jgi:hypothetical protein
MISTKANYSAKSGLRYKIVTVPVKLDDGSTDDVPCIEWLGESDANPDVLLDPKQQLQKGRPAVERDTAVEFLREFLKDGPRSAMKCTEAVQQGGFSKRTLMAAKKELGILSTRDGQGPWMWSLPPQEFSFDDPDSVTWNNPDVQSKKQLAEDTALAFLERHLKDGPRSKDDCIAAAKSEGISVPVLLKIRKDFGISSRNSGGAFLVASTTELIMKSTAIPVRARYRLRHLASLSLRDLSDRVGTLQSPKLDELIHQPPDFDAGPRRIASRIRLSAVRSRSAIKMNPAL